MAIGGSGGIETLAIKPTSNGIAMPVSKFYRSRVNGMITEYDEGLNIESGVWESISDYEAGVELGIIKPKKADLEKAKRRRRRTSQEVAEANKAFEALEAEAGEQSDGNTGQ